MSDTDASSSRDMRHECFHEFWRVIQRWEEYIRNYACVPCPDWEDRWRDEIEDAYVRVKPFLDETSQRSQLHCDVPPGVDPVLADNALQLLTLILNPPERWFGQGHMLDSAEYITIRQRALKETRRAAGEIADHAVLLDKMRVTKAKGPKRLQAMLLEYHRENPDEGPLNQDQMAEKMACWQGTISKWMPHAFKDGMEGYLRAFVVDAPPAGVVDSDGNVDGKFE